MRGEAKKVKCINYILYSEHIMDLVTDKKSISKTIYYNLKEEIITLQLVPGTFISEKEIATRYNVSRTPVREALVRLAQEELVNIYPQRGTVISLIDLSAVEEGRFLREHLERAVVKEACSKLSKEIIFELEMNLKLQKMYIENKDYKKLFDADEEFHKIIFKGCNKQRIWKSICDTSTEFQRIRFLRLTVNSDWENIYMQHKDIFSAIEKADKSLAEEVMEKHLKMVILDEKEIIDKYPNYLK